MYIQTAHFNEYPKTRTFLALTLHNKYYSQYAIHIRSTQIRSVSKSRDMTKEDPVSLSLMQIGILSETTSDESVNDVTYMRVMTFQITSHLIVCSTDDLVWQQRNHQGSTLLALCKGSPPLTGGCPSQIKGPVMQNVRPAELNRFSLGSIDWFALRKSSNSKTPGASYYHRTSVRLLISYKWSHWALRYYCNMTLSPDF